MGGTQLPLNKPIGVVNIGPHPFPLLAFSRSEAARDAHTRPTNALRGTRQGAA